jgi:hypothetical protein
MNGYDSAGFRNEGYYTKTTYHILQTGNSFTWLCIEESTDVACGRNIASCVSFE